MKVSWKSLRASYDISLRAGSVKHSTPLVRSLWYPRQQQLHQ